MSGHKKSIKKVKKYCECGFPQSSPIPHSHSSAKEKAMAWVKRQRYNTSAYAWRVEAYAAGYRAGIKDSEK